MTPIITARKGDTMFPLVIRLKDSDNVEIDLTDYTLKGSVVGCNFTKEYDISTDLGYGVWVFENPLDIPLGTYELWAKLNENTEGYQTFLQAILKVEPEKVEMI